MSDESIVFYIAHYRANETSVRLLNMCVKGIKRFYPDADIVVCESNSTVEVKGYDISGTILISNPIQNSRTIGCFKDYLIRYKDTMKKGIFIHDNIILKGMFNSEKLARPFGFLWSCIDGIDPRNLQSTHLKRWLMQQLSKHNMDSDDYVGCVGNALYGDYSSINTLWLKIPFEEYMGYFERNSIISDLQSIIGAVAFQEKLVDSKDCALCGDINTFPDAYKNWYVNQTLDELMKYPYDESALKIWEKRWHCPSQLFAVQIFNLDLDVCTIDKIQSIVRKIYGTYIQITNWNLSVDHMGKPTQEVKYVNRFTWDYINMDMIKLFQNEYDNILSRYDAFIVTSAPVYAMLYEKYNKPIIIINSMHYDDHPSLNKNTAMLNLFNESLKRLYEKEQLIIVSTDREGQIYLKDRTGIDSIYMSSLSESDSLAFQQWNGILSDIFKEENSCRYVGIKGILKSCDIYSRNLYNSDLTTYNNIEGLKDGSSIFIRGDNLSVFIDNFSNFKYRVVIVVGNGDQTFPNDFWKSEDEFIKFIESDKILHIFSVNSTIMHNKHTKIPIGLDYHSTSYIDKGVKGHYVSKMMPLECDNLINEIISNRQSFDKRIIKCYSNFHFNMQTDRRYTYDRKDALEKIPKECVYYEEKILPRKQSFINQLEYAYVISPHGNGLDCHRTWEALVLGCIPIVKSSCLDQLYDELPVLIVEDWSDITQELLEETVKVFKEQKFNYEKLTLKYWMDKIDSVKEVEKEG